MEELTLAPRNFKGIIATILSAIGLTVFAGTISPNLNTATLVGNGDNVTFPADRTNVRSSAVFFYLPAPGYAELRDGSATGQLIRRFDTATTNTSVEYLYQANLTGSKLFLVSNVTSATAVIDASGTR